MVGAIALGRYLQSLIVGLAPHDLPTYVVVAATFSAVAIVAADLPALRATKVNPLISPSVLFFVSRISTRRRIG
jgi:hypothetical protein